MKRREFVEKVGAGSAALLAGGVIAGGMSGPASADQQGEHHHDDVSGPLANATVSFGAWPMPLDRTALPPGPPPNIHRLIPGTTTIKAGGSVNFIVAGFHHVVVYGPGKKPGDVNTGLLQAMPGAPPDFPMTIDDADKRVYRGPFPFGLPQDRVEVVHFARRGVYLVICAFLPHFEDDMFGWVRVVR